jgi:hypothetical protein
MLLKWPKDFRSKYRSESFLGKNRKGLPKYFPSALTAQKLFGLSEVRKKKMNQQTIILSLLFFIFCFGNEMIFGDCPVPVWANAVCSSGVCNCPDYQNCRVNCASVLNQCEGYTINCPKYSGNCFVNCNGFGDPCDDLTVSCPSLPNIVQINFFYSFSFLVELLSRGMPYRVCHRCFLWWYDCKFILHYSYSSYFHFIFISYHHRIIL